MVKVISFDIWGTLLDLERMLDGITFNLSELTGRESEEVKSAFKKARIIVREMRYKGKLSAKEAVNISQGLFARELKVDVDLVKRACVRAVINMDGNIVLPGVLEALDWVKKRFKLACLGNVQFWPSSLTRVLLEKFGISNHLDKHFFSDEIGAFKPEKKVFEEVVSFFGVLPNEVLHVGDREKEDYEGAKEAGFKALLVRKGVPLDLQLKEYLESVD
ncbi:hydrolase of the HAD superfamily [Thermosulfidibacter takaii ABI70S6]|uniref:Hydrolase of the HAD superfamily n=1 Tax=Thermosulfidibacter takaii (strain DSM 17441 / JCM 13301 / NBRC 103674 / ABI70S6) TaxID=1298851 RepID=A0A0S3QVL9_THET7|nr:HAD family hydrolase [Thermosulfidibacter takaii]BAT72359.1 hydrolase of the HAD superfamily [Thermosulfidibacter takaii ABI70S6]